MATLTRREMEQILAEGGSVMYKGRVITRAANLPTEADLAEGDSTRSAAVVQSLDQQIATLHAQRAQLTGAEVAAVAAALPAAPASSAAPASTPRSTRPKAGTVPSTASRDAAGGEGEGDGSDLKDSAGAGADDDKQD